MAPDFEKANEIYFRLGIIYKQQQKFNQSLEVCSNIWYINRWFRLTDPFQVLQIHRQRPTSSPYRGRHLVPDRPRSRTAERCKRRSLLCLLKKGHTDTDSRNSSRLHRRHTSACWIATPTMRKYCSSLVGCITSRPLTPVKREQLNIWRSRLAQVSFGQGPSFAVILTT